MDIPSPVDINRQAVVSAVAKTNSDFATIHIKMLDLLNRQPQQLILQARRTRAIACFLVGAYAMILAIIESK